MSWVRQAIDGIKAHPYEELYPTAYGSSAEKPDIFWALNPNDVPPPVKGAVEAAVRQQTAEIDLTCAIIRLETLSGYYASENKSTSTDEPVGQFAIYLGTSPADTELTANLPTDLGNPPTTTPRPPPTDGRSQGQASTHPSSIPGGAGADTEQEDGAQTPLMSEIEEDYSRVEDRSKRTSKRLSKITASVGNWIRLN